MFIKLTFGRNFGTFGNTFCHSFSHFGHTFRHSFRGTGHTFGTHLKKYESGKYTSSESTVSKDALEYKKSTQKNIDSIDHIDHIASSNGMSERSSKNTIDTTHLDDALSDFSNLLHLEIFVVWIELQRRKVY